MFDNFTANIMDSLFRLGSYICHQRPDRSFAVGGYHFFLCARCSGIYCALIVMLIAPRFRGPEKEFLMLYIILIVSLITNAVTTVCPLLDTNPVRFILGALIGVPAGLILKKSLTILFKRGNP